MTIVEARGGFFEEPYTLKQQNTGESHDRQVWHGRKGENAAGFGRRYEFTLSRSEWMR
jgi:hypothetical protein